MSNFTETEDIIDRLRYALQNCMRLLEEHSVTFRQRAEYEELIEEAE